VYSDTDISTSSQNVFQNPIHGTLVRGVMTEAVYKTGSICLSNFA
jgi:hypothetical protein